MKYLKSYFRREVKQFKEEWEREEVKEAFFVALTFGVIITILVISLSLLIL